MKIKIVLEKEDAQNAIKDFLTKKNVDYTMIHSEVSSPDKEGVQRITLDIVCRSLEDKKKKSKMVKKKNHLCCDENDCECNNLACVCDCCKEYRRRLKKQYSCIHCLDAGCNRCEDDVCLKCKGNGCKNCIDYDCLYCEDERCEKCEDVDVDVLRDEDVEIVEDEDCDDCDCDDPPRKTKRKPKLKKKIPAKEDPCTRDEGCDDEDCDDCADKDPPEKTKRKLREKIKPFLKGDRGYDKCDSFCDCKCNNYDCICC